MTISQRISLYFQFCLLLLLSIPAYAWKMEAGKLTLSATGSMNQLESHLFQQIYDVPPVVIALTTTTGGNASVIRISDVTTTGFQMSPVEPKSEDGPHAAMTVSYIAIEPGVHTFPNGETIEAGRINTNSIQFNGNPNGRKSWQTLNFTNTFSAPVVLAAIQSTNNEPGIDPSRPSHPWLSVALSAITNSQASIALERSEVYDRITGSNFQFDALGSSESIGYVVMNRGLRGNFRASGNLLVNFESLYSANSVRGWTDGCRDINFAGSYSAAPIALATKASRNEADGGWLRECSINSNRIQLTIDEDTDQDNERSHVAEDVSLLVFSNSFFYDSNAATSLNSSSALMLESNRASLSPNSFTTINFEQIYDYPPAVFVLGDNQNPEPSSVRIRNITTQGFQVVPVEPDSTVADAADQSTGIHYLAVSKGQFTFPDGTRIEIGPTVPPSQIINFQSKRLSGSSWFNFNYGTSFSAPPALLSQIQSMHSETGHTPGSASRPWITMAASNMSVSGGLLALDRAETNTGSISGAEDIAWLAIENGLINDFKDVRGNTIAAEAQTTPNNLAGTLSCNSYNFLQGYATGPLVIGSQMTRDGGDGGWLRRCTTSSTQVSLKIEEDWALDRDNSHTTEQAGFLAFSEPFAADFSLVANYQLEGPSWNSTAGEVLDSSNSGLHGQAFGDARPFPAQICNGANLDGNRDYIAIPDSPVLDINDELTVMAWVNTRSLPVSDLKTILSKDTNYEFHIDSAGRVFWWWNNSSGVARSFDSGATRVSLGAWHHIAITYSRSAGLQKIFLDGVEANRQTYVNESLINNNLPLYIGTDDNYPTRDFDGQIDEVKIFRRALSQSAIQKYAAESRPCASCVLGSFDITQPPYALACPDTRAEVEITARCVDGSVKTDYSGTVNLSGPTGSSFFNAATAGSAINSLSYTFADSGTQKTYLYFNNEQSDVKVTVQDASAAVSSTATMGTQFNAFGFDIRTQPGNFACGNNTNMNLVAYGKVDNSPGGTCAVISGFNGNKTLDAWFSADLNDDATQDIVSSALTLGSTPIATQDNSANNNLQLDFVNGEASFAVRYPNAAKILNLNFRYDTAPYDGSQFSAMQSSSAAFVVRPDRFQLRASSGSNLLDGNSSGSSVTHKAGQVFELSVTSQCSDGATATEYAPNNSNTLMAYLQRTGPVGGTSVNGEMPIAASKILTSNPSAMLAWELANIGPGDFSNGVYSYSGARYSEVGLTRLYLTDMNYFGIQVPMVSLDIGRFIPDHFEVSTQAGSLDAYCSSGTAPAFSYIGQAIPYATLPEVVIQARSAQNTVTQNYTEAGYLKLLPGDVSRVFPNIDSTQFGRDGSNKLALSSSYLDPTSFSAALSGSIRYTFVNTDSFTYTRNANALVGPFNSDLKIEISNIEDPDGVGSNAEPYDIHPLPVQLRYGRWVLDNAFGPETQNLGIPMRVEYWNSSNFAVNRSDSCTTYDASNLNLTPSLSGGASSASGSGTLVSGSVPLTAQISLSAPGNGNTGQIQLEYLVDSWLTYDWDNDPLTPDSHPTAAAEFGQYRGHDRIIYWREVDN